MNNVIEANTTRRIHKTFSIVSKKAAKWEKVGPHMYGAVVEVDHTDIYNVTRKSKVAIRLDGRDLLQGYRVDAKSLAFEPWESIDGGFPFKTLKDAKRFVSAWLKA